MPDDIAACAFDGLTLVHPLLCETINKAVRNMQAEVRGASLFIMSHEVDMQNPVCWLSRAPLHSKGPAFNIPEDRADVNPIRRVLQPFQMRVSQHASRPDAASATAAARFAHVQVCQLVDVSKCRSPNRTQWARQRVESATIAHMP